METKLKKRGKLFLSGIGILLGLLILFLAGNALIYSPEYVLRIAQWRESDVSDYLYNFPQRQLEAAPEPFNFDLALVEDRVSGLFERILEVDDFDTFLEEANTQAFIVIQNDAILYEEYFNGTQRDSMATSFSVAKSFTSALIGIAIEDGYISSVDDPITSYLPELAARDARFNDIRIRHLLLMSSGLEYQSHRSWFFNGDDPLTTYFPNQRQAALEFTNIVDPPGENFLYNHYHPQLLGLILERTTGISVTAYLQEKIWNPIGMEFDGSWSLDSESSGFEKMEAGINARPIDFAKFGRLFLEGGNWNGVQIIPNEWITESTQVDQSIQTAVYYPNEYGQAIFNQGTGYYKYFWYGKFRGDGESDYYAEGDRGQMIYVSPQNNLIITRNGFEYGIPQFDWIDAFYLFATEINQ
jgi:CubicO group peptidase (beta-lactamase class C family)